MYLDYSYDNLSPQTVFPFFWLENQYSTSRPCPLGAVGAKAPPRSETAGRWAANHFNPNLPATMRKNNYVYVDYLQEAFQDIDSDAAQVLRDLCRKNAVCADFLVAKRYSHRGTLATGARAAACFVLCQPDLPEHGKQEMEISGDGNFYDYAEQYDTWSKNDIYSSILLTLIKHWDSPLSAVFIFPLSWAEEERWHGLLGMYSLEKALRALGRGAGLIEHRSKIVSASSFSRRASYRATVTTNKSGSGTNKSQTSVQKQSSHILPLSNYNKFPSHKFLDNINKDLFMERILDQLPPRRLQPEVRELEVEDRDLLQGQHDLQEGLGRIVEGTLLPDLHSLEGGHPRRVRH